MSVEEQLSALMEEFTKIQAENTKLKDLIVRVLRHNDIYKHKVLLEDLQEALK